MVFFRDSIQEQKFLTSARREREAFEQLIRIKQMMAVPEDQDGRKGFRQEMEMNKCVRRPPYDSPYGAPMVGCLYTFALRQGKQQTHDPSYDSP